MYAFSISIVLFELSLPIVSRIKTPLGTDSYT